jgi:hypothetical protein
MHTLEGLALETGPSPRVFGIDRWRLLFAAAVLLVVSGTVRGILSGVDSAGTPPPEPPEPPASVARPVALAPR